MQRQFSDRTAEHWDFEVRISGETLPDEGAPGDFTGVTVRNDQDGSTVLFGRTSVCTIRWLEKTACISFCQNAEEREKVLVDYLKILFSFLVIQKGGLPLHSSTVCREGEGLVFFGPSEAGKSTIAGLLAPVWRLLNDEVNFIMPDNGSFRVWSTPFSTSENFPKCSDGSARIKKIFSLHKDVSNKVSDLPFKQKYLLLTGSVYTLPVTGELVEQMMENAENICKSVPVQQLSFRKDRSIADDMPSFMI